MVQMHVKHGEERVWIALDTVRFDSRTDCRLGKNQFCQLVHMQLLGVALKKLSEQALDGVIVDIGVRVKEFE